MVYEELSYPGFKISSNSLDSGFGSVAPREKIYSIHYPSN